MLSHANICLLAQILHQPLANRIRSYTNQVRLRGNTENQGFETRVRLCRCRRLGGESSPEGGLARPRGLANPKGFCLCSQASAAGGLPSVGDWRANSIRQVQDVC